MGFTIILFELRRNNIVMKKWSPQKFPTKTKFFRKFLQARLPKVFQFVKQNMTNVRADFELNPLNTFAGELFFNTGSRISKIFIFPKSVGSAHELRCAEEFPNVQVSTLNSYRYIERKSVQGTYSL